MGDETTKLLNKYEINTQIRKLNNDSHYKNKTPTNNPNRNERGDLIRNNGPVVNRFNSTLLASTLTPSMGHSFSISLSLFLSLSRCPLYFLLGLRASPTSPPTSPPTSLVSLSQCGNAAAASLKPTSTDAMPVLLIPPGAVGFQHGAPRRRLKSIPPSDIH